jgi:hypothetical protein
MTPQRIEQSPQQIESRVAALETELGQVKQILSGFIQKDIPWWVKIAGSSEHDPTFDDAVRYGIEWRKSAE